MNRYGTLANGPVDRDRERLLRELEVERAPGATTTRASSSRPAPSGRIRHAVAALLHPRPTSALR